MSGTNNSDEKGTVQKQLFKTQKSMEKLTIQPAKEKEAVNMS